MKITRIGWVNKRTSIKVTIWSNKEWADDLCLTAISSKKRQDARKVRVTVEDCE